MRFGQIIRKVLPIIGIGIFIYLLIKLNIVDILKEIENVNLNILSIAVLIVFIFFMMQTSKWFIVAKEQKIKIHFWEAFKINFIANFYGFVTPGKIGTIIRIDYLKDKGDTGRALSNFVIDKVLDFCSLFLLTVSFGFIFYKAIVSATYLYIILGFFAIVIILAFLFYKKDSTKPILRFLYKIFVPSKLKGKSRELFDSFYREMPSPGFLFLTFIVNLSNWIICYSAVYFMALALGINIGFVPFMAILPITTFVAQIPITISGFGTREITMIGLFGLFGIEAVKVFSLSVLNIFISSIIPAIFTMFLLFKRGRK